MQFDPKAYGPEVAGILALDGDGERLMPLVHAPHSSHEAKAALDALARRKLLAGSFILMVINRSSGLVLPGTDYHDVGQIWRAAGT